ncbi:MAG: ScpA family protein [Pseudomonadota bacterium]
MTGHTDDPTPRSGPSDDPGDAATHRAADDAAWDAPTNTDRPALRQDDDESLIVDIDGYSGPLDLLLALARTQKVDLAEISVLELTEQYLAHIRDAQALRLGVAADYLVMAAWLTFLKSRLLMPRDDDAQDAVPADELARRLAFRLVRLDAMRRSGAALMQRTRLDRDVFARGAEERITTRRERITVADLNDLLQAYGRQRSARAVRVHVVAPRRVWSIKDARVRLERLIGRVAPGDWMQLELCLGDVMPDSSDSSEGRTALAASFGASLELAREGHIQLRQDRHFAPVFLKAAMRSDEDSAP